MNFNVGDRVIFKESSFHVTLGTSSFVKDKEYTIDIKRIGNFNSYMYALKNEYNQIQYVYEHNLLISVMYLRDKTIEDILE